MIVYTKPELSASVTWQGLIEPIWQTLPGYSQSLPGWKRTDIGLSECLFIGAVLNLPKGHRQWGVVSWLSETMEVSRPTLYAIGEWARSALLPGLVRAMGIADPDAAAQATSHEKTIKVTPNRIKRMALSLLLPGGVPDRSAEVCLQAAFWFFSPQMKRLLILHERNQLWVGCFRIYTPRVLPGVRSRVFR